MGPRLLPANDAAIEGGCSHLMRARSCWLQVDYMAHEWALLGAFQTKAVGFIGQMSIVLAATLSNFSRVAPSRASVDIP